MYDIKTIAGMFDLRGDFVFGEPYGSGHINDTFRVVVDQAGLRVSYILQRINSNVFRQPIPLMENVKRVTDEALRVLLEEGCKEAYRRTLTIVNAKDGKPYAQDADGNVWRVYPFIDRARTYDMLSVPSRSWVPIFPALRSLRRFPISTTPLSASRTSKLLWLLTRWVVLLLCRRKSIGSFPARLIATWS